jgi:hypothetical protein
MGFWGFEESNTVKFGMFFVQFHLARSRTCGKHRQTMWTGTSIFSNSTACAKCCARFCLDVMGASSRETLVAYLADESGRLERRIDFVDGR